MLGKRFALAMRQHVYGEMINGTGPRLLDVTQAMAEPNLIVVTFNKPVNDVVNAYENEFRVRSKSAEVPIKSIRRGQNASRIEIEIPRNPGGDLFVEYGVQPSIGNNLFLTNVVRDVDNLPAPVFGPVKVRTL